ncbi:FHA domain-containing protein [Streptomyces yaanensis]|uniref:FHA domain-containing protein n=1 Tax=Streptomyces yaanensis TaxID=1142239 RepID=A0ABV7SDH1_9ACTN|nr:FHA domain-containing protein [Streptomyces sp. CGMCC 4.7035]WNC02967.1 FHA domain-containing protein [Streptomyces sp. CGMCC 4.7035]
MGAGSEGGPPYLVVVVPSRFAGQKWELSGTAHVVGRFGDIRLSSLDVSKRHAEVRRGSDGVWVNDLDSRNGVLHNGRRIESGRPVRLAEGDRLQFGSVQVVFRGNAPQPRPGQQTSPTDPDRTTAWPGTHASPSGSGRSYTVGDSSVTDVRDFRWRRARRGHGPDSDLPDPPPHHADPPPIEDDARTMATRHLAAATQLDPAFADLVVGQVIDEPYRALAPVFGADLGVVTRWALEARRRRLTRDLVLAALLVTLLTVLGLGVRDHLGTIREAGFGGDWWRPYAVGAVALLGMAWPVVAVDLWVRDYLVLRRRLSARHYEPARAPQALGGRARARLAVVAERPAGNLVVCSDYLPFAGSGDQVAEWDRPVDIRRGSIRRDGGRRDPQRFRTDELYDVLIAAARRLGLANLRVDERLFVDGTSVAHDRRLLPDRLRPPLTRIPTGVIRGMPDGLGSTRRSYVSIEVPAWSGQLVLTMFLRAVQVEGTLYLEFSAYALLPMRPEYYAVDRLPYRTGPGAVVRALSTALPRTLPTLLRAPGALARRAADSRAGAARRHRQRRTISGGYLFDYGAHYSIRELARSQDEGHYFLGRDLSRVLNTTQQHLLNTIGDFLESKGIDSDDFQRLQQNVVQNFGDDKRVYVRDNHGALYAHSKHAQRQPGGKAPAPGRTAPHG